jgi:hypothetical protein
LLVREEFSFGVGSGVEARGWRGLHGLLWHGLGIGWCSAVGRDRCARPISMRVWSHERGVV